MQKQIYKTLWKLLKKMPPLIRGRITRSFFEVTLPEGIYADVEYKIASTIEEVEQAMELVQECYRDSDMIDDCQRFRISKYNALPTTTIFIAKYKGEVIATVSQVLNTGLGLPIDKFSDISFLKNTGKRISEISSLAIRKDWRSRSKGISIALTFYATKYVDKYIGSDYLVISVRESVRNFYEDLLFFKCIKEKNKKYDGIKISKSVSMFLELKRIEIDMKSGYQGRKLEKNLYLLYKEFIWEKQCYFPEDNSFSISKKIFSKNELDYFFNKESGVFRNLTFSEKEILKTFYYDHSIDNIISLYGESAYDSQRKSARIQVNMSGKVKNIHKLIPIKILELSNGGIGFYCGECLETASVLSGYIDIGYGTKLHFSATIRWMYKGKVGVEFKEIDKSKYLTFISSLKNKITHYCDENSQSIAA